MVETSTNRRTVDGTQHAPLHYCSPGISKAVLRRQPPTRAQTNTCPVSVMPSAGPAHPYPSTQNRVAYSGYHGKEVLSSGHNFQKIYRQHRATPSGRNLNIVILYAQVVDCSRHSRIGFNGRSLVHHEPCCLKASFTCWNFGVRP